MITAKASPFYPEKDVQTVEVFAGPIDGETQTTTEQPITFSDLERWIRVLWEDGREYMITDKGDHIHPEDGNHLEVFAMDRNQPQRLLFHESWVNEWLKKPDTAYFDVAAMEET